MLPVLLLLEVSDGLVQKAAASYRDLVVLRSLLADHLLHDLAITWRSSSNRKSMSGMVAEVFTGQTLTAACQDTVAGKIMAQMF